LSFPVHFEGIKCLTSGAIEDSMTLISAVPDPRLKTGLVHVYMTTWTRQVRGSGREAAIFNGLVFDKGMFRLNFRESLEGSRNRFTSHTFGRYPPCRCDNEHVFYCEPILHPNVTCSEPLLYHTHVFDGRPYVGQGVSLSASIGDRRRASWFQYGLPRFENQNI
jgi:hypothetical protein